MSTLEDDRTVSDEQLSNLERSFAAPSSTASESGTSVTAPRIDDENTAADNTMNYSGNQGGKSKIKASRGWWNKKRAGIAGSITGIGVGGGLLGLSFLSGPLQFIHLASILKESHFSQQENASDGRMGKLIRYFRSGEAGETRVGLLGSKYNARIMSQLADVGITVKSSTIFGSLAEINVDTSHEKSPYAGMSDDDAAKALKTRYGGAVTSEGDGKFKVKISGTYRGPAKGAAGLIQDLGHGKVSSAARARPIKKWFGISLNPLSIIDTKANAKAEDIYNKYKEKWDNRLKNGTTEVTVNATSATDGEENGKPVAASGDDISAANGAAKNSESILKSLSASKGLKVTGGLAAAAGLACALKGVDDNIGYIKYSQVIIPMMRVGMEAISVGEQIESGQNVDPDELAYLQHYMSSTTNGNTSSWNDASTIRAETGDTGGVDVDQGIQDTIAQGQPSWLSWTQSSAISGLCGTPGQVVTGVLSVGVGLVSGETVSTAASLVAGAIAGPKLISYVSNLLAGDALNVDSLSGAQYGGVADYGAALVANSTSLATGGVKLTDAQIAQNNGLTAQEQKQTFNSENFIARTFDTNNYQSLASILINGQSSSFMRNVATATSGIASTLSDVLALPMKLYSSAAHATSASTSYPFATYGFSQSDLASSTVEDPYANAQAVQELLDSPSGQSYIDKAKSCFAVSINKDSGVWDVSPGDQSASSSFNPYSSSGSDAYPSDCTSPSGLDQSDWLRVRFFILDTGTMEGYTCAEFDDTDSCANNDSDNSVASDVSDDSASSVTASDEAPSYCKDGTATGNEKIVCSAYNLFDDYDYSAPGHRGNASYLKGFLADVKTCVNNKYGSGCKYPKFTPLVDCSGMVDASVYDALGVDLKGAATSSYASNSHLQKLSSYSQTKPGDIILFHGHTEIIVSYDGKTFNTFGAHTSHRANAGQIGPASFKADGSTRSIVGVYRVVP